MGTRSRPGGASNIRSDDSSSDEIDRATFIRANTRKTNHSVLNQFAMFCEEKKYQLLPTLTDEEIALILKDWACNMRRKDGHDYKESVVKIMWNITANRVQEMYYTRYKIAFDPFHDIIFEAARGARDAKRQQLKTIAGKRKQSLTVLSDDQSLQMINLYDEDTPKGLIHKLYLVLTTELRWALRAANNSCLQNFREEITIDGNVTGRIEYNPSLFKSSAVTQARSTKSRWLEPNLENANLCPVRLFKKYLSKRGLNMHTDRLFLAVNHQWSVRGNSWYKMSPVGMNEIKKWIKEAADKIGLDTTRNKFTIRSLYGTLVKKPTVGQLKTLSAGEDLLKVIKLKTENDDDGQIIEEEDQGPSTSTRSYSQNETNESIYSVTDEDSTAEDMYQDDGDLEGDVDGDGEGEADETKMDILDISDTHILQEAVKPLTVEVNNEHPTPGECELFGEYIARHLQRLPLEVALKLQSGIHNLVMQTRLEYIREHPSEAPVMVKEEPSEEEESRPPQTDQPANDSPVQSRTEKRPQMTDHPPSGTKRFKPDNSRSETQNSSTLTSPCHKNKRTDSCVFAEHIALQLEQLPEEVSLQLQSDIYALITQACPTTKPADGGSPHRVKIKTETVESTPAELIDGYFESYE